MEGSGDHVTELPEEVLIEIFKYLDEKDIKNVHLVSRSFHQAAEFYPYTFSLEYYSNQCEVGKELKCKVHAKTSSIQQSPRIRIYETVTIRCNQSYLCHHIERFFENFGTGIKSLELRSCNTNQQTCLNILNLLPNLKKLSMTGLTITEQQEIEEKTINLPKLKILTIQRSREVYSILNHINCSIRELQIDYLDENFTLLQKNEASLKKLTVNIRPKYSSERSDIENGMKILSNLRNLRLEHFYIHLMSSKRISFDQQDFSIFLSQHEDMKFLNLVMTDINAEIILSTICEFLKKLETLKVQMSGSFSEGAERNLANLKKLKNLHLTLTNLDTVAVLNALSLEKNENLEILEMKSSKDFPIGQYPNDLHLKIPNLKKITLGKQDAETIRYILKNFLNLEYFEATHFLSGLHYKNCFDKTLNSSRLMLTGSTFRDKNILNLFHNVKDLHISSVDIFDDDLEEILINLPTLKELIITNFDFQKNNEFSHEAANHIFMYGRNLKRFEFPRRCAEEHVRRKLKDRNLYFKCSNFEIKFPCYIQPTYSRRTTTSRSRRSYDYFDDDY